MTNELPVPVSHFIRALNERHREELLAAFAKDGVVKDEGRTFTGPEEIGEWFDKHVAAIDVRLDILQKETDGGEIAVDALVSGSFDGSPLPFKFRFAISGGDCIQSLTIIG